METLTLQIPEPLYQRLLVTASATRQSLEAVVLRSIQVGCPPTWDDIPEPFQVDIAALDKLDDDTLWQIARSHETDRWMLCKAQGAALLRWRGHWVALS